MIEPGEEKQMYQFTFEDDGTALGAEVPVLEIDTPATADKEAAFVRPDFESFYSGKMPRQDEFIAALLENPNPVADPRNILPPVCNAVSWQDSAGKYDQRFGGIDLASWVIAKDGDRVYLDAEQTTEFGDTLFSLEITPDSMRVLYDHFEGDGGFHSRRRVVVSAPLNSVSPVNLLDATPRPHGLIVFEENTEGSSTSQSVSVYGVTGEPIPGSLALGDAITRLGPTVETECPFPPADDGIGLRIFPVVDCSDPQLGEVDSIALSLLPAEVRGNYLETTITPTALWNKVAIDEPLPNGPAHIISLEDPAQQDPALFGNILRYYVDEMATRTFACLEENDIVRGHALTALAVHIKASQRPYALGLLDESNKTFYGPVPTDWAMELFAPEAYGQLPDSDDPVDLEIACAAIRTSGVEYYPPLATPLQRP